ncbi:MAG: orotidine-5'-phosphate decarboxylase [Desulfobacterota bacterium]|nr:orotidine-5'-phosphate decarboxylase [Thermodesulfobacteriota bacterium]
MNNPIHKKIIIALDVDELARARTLVEQLQHLVGGFKIGKQLFTRFGPEAVHMVRTLGGMVFLDLKFHDIPNTVAGACAAAARIGASMVTLHTMGGATMLREAVAAVSRCSRDEGCTRPLLLGVTVLTSLRDQDLRRLGIQVPLDELVLSLAQSAYDAGLDGVVASPREAARIKQCCGSAFLVVTPGIRPVAAAQHDQHRTLTPAAAIRAGADYLVIGRPITAAPDPQAAVAAIVEEMRGA